MIKEYDIVAASRMLSNKVSIGTKGVVLLIYDAIMINFEVEFVDADGNTLEILTVSYDDVSKVNDIK
jgi:hypothetical protein